MTDGVYILTDNIAQPTDLARGPWDPNAQHGGAPAALLARLVERSAAPQTVVNITVEFLHPVPLRPLTTLVTGGVGRTVGRWTASLAEEGRTMARAQALSCRTNPGDVVLSRTPAGERLRLPDHDQPLRIPGMPEQRSFYYTAMEAKLATGTVKEAGPAAAWFRLRHPIIADEEPTPLVRAVAAADFASGISWELPFGQYFYANADLTVYLHRMPIGEWIGVDALTRIDTPGIGVTITRLFDGEGLFGGAHQTLVVSYGTVRDSLRS